jgi:hypothetical protein
MDLIVSAANQEKDHQAVSVVKAVVVLLRLPKSNRNNQHL